MTVLHTWLATLVKLVYHGTENISWLDSKIRDIQPNGYKTIENLNTFKIKIKKWKPQNCPFRCRELHINRVGFLFKNVKLILKKA